MCAECEGQLCPVTNHHWSETGFVFPPSLRQLKERTQIKLSFYGKEV